MNAPTIPTHADRGVIRFHEAVLLQLRFLWLSRRPLVLVAAVVTAVLLVWRLVSFPTSRMSIVYMLWFLFIGPGWAFAVWTDEPPSARSYVWSQPAKRTHQSLARVLAGLLWLWAVLFVMLTIGIATKPFHGQQLAPFLQLDLSMLVFLSLNPTILYLMVSCLNVVFERPFWWMVGLLLLWILSVEWISRIGGAFGDFHVPSVFFRRGSEVGPAEWVGWPLWVAALFLLVWALAHIHPDHLVRWTPKILRKLLDA